METGYFGDAGGSIFGYDGRGQSGGARTSDNKAAMSQLQAAAIQAMSCSTTKGPSPVERELRQLEENVKRLSGEIDSLASQLAPVIVPQLEAKNPSQGEQTGSAASPLHHSIYTSNVQITKLSFRVAQIRASLSI